MCTENQNSGKESESKNRDLLNYAWKWFEYHAKQRTSMFNYFLIASGILAHACVNLICEQCFLSVAIFAFIGVIISISFLAIDFRNADLIYISEDVLRRLEYDMLFPMNFKGLGESGNETNSGILYREFKEPKAGIRKCTKHKCMLPLIQIMIAACFFVLCFFGTVCWLIDP